MYLLEENDNISQFSNDDLLRDMKEMSVEFDQLKSAVSTGLKRMEDLSDMYNECEDELKKRGINVDFFQEENKQE